MLLNYQSNLSKNIISLNNLIDKRLVQEQNNLDRLINTLKLVNPLNILSNGYSLVKKNDTIIKNSKDIKVNDEINIKLYKGEINAIVKEKKDER